MQVLEMEEIETLVSNGNRKRLGDNRGSKRKRSFLGILYDLSSRGDFLSKLVVAACLLLLVVMYFSAQDQPKDPISKPKEGFSPTTDFSVETDATITLKPTNGPTGLPTQPPVEMEEDVEEILAITDEEVVEEEVEVEDEDDEEEEEEEQEEEHVEENHENDAYLYSRYATIRPLVDHPLPSEEIKDELAEKYGKWHFWDGEEEERPMEDYTAKYANRDIPGDEFPEYAWQADAVYVNHILNDADQLIARTMEAIFVEYGHGKPLPAEGLAARMKMFHWSKEDLSALTAAPEKYGKRGDRGNGGWTTRRSFDGLVRRLLHAMMTQDTFTVVMGGHSAAAGQGNHFRQSYMMQFHKVMYPVFARLGVKLITRNVGMGGLGTMQGGMGSGSIYGDEVDILMWDSGMTEPESEYVEVFYRQALLAGKRIPVLWGGPFNLLKMLHEEADVDVGDWGQAMDGIPEVESPEQAETIPWAARYMKCTDDAQELCTEEPRFCSKCWIDREDNIVPDKKQLDNPKGQVKWHPGWRRHQLAGRNLAFAILEALQAAVNLWTENVMGGPPLEDEFWHVTKYYENIRNKLKNLDDKGTCSKIVEKGLPERLCTIPMKAKTQYTPRADFYDSALTTIIKPTSDGYVPENKKKFLYEGPDAHNTCFDIPDGEIDVFNVVTGRRHLVEDELLPASLSSTSSRSNVLNNDRTRRLGDAVTPGRGWKVRDEPPGLCDGTYNATCGRDKDSECFLYGHHDARGAVIGDESAGWLVMNLDDLVEGVIILKLHTWYTRQEYDEAEPVDTRRLGQSLHSSDGDRILKTRSYDTPELPEAFAFEYAIDGKITRLSKDEFLNEKKQIQRVVETLTILDDPNFTSESKNVEIAIRLVGSGKDIVFGVSHVYWA